MLKKRVFKLIIFSIFAVTRSFSQNIDEEQIKVVYTYNFMKSIDWNREIDVYKIAVLTKNEHLMEMFNLLSLKKKLNGKSIKVEQNLPLHNVRNIFNENYHSIFIDEEFKYLIDEVFEKVEQNNLSTLIITNNFENKNRVMINLFKIDCKINFEINRANILNRGLKISADMVLLGGREIDIAQIYRDLQNSLEIKKREIKSLNIELSSIKEERLLLEKDIENKREEFLKERATLEKTKAELTKIRIELENSKDEIKESELSIEDQKRIFSELENSLKTQNINLEKKRTEFKEMQENFKIKSQEVEKKEMLLKQVNEAINFQKILMNEQQMKIDGQDLTITYLIASLTIFILLISLIVLGYLKIIRDRKVIKNQNLVLQRLNSDIEIQFLELELLNKEIEDSIEYASYIQKAILSDNSTLDIFFKEHFILWKPREKVGGDIFFSEIVSEDEILMLIFDCTSHGVPGAFVTMLVKAVEKQLNTEIKYNRVLPSSPAEILSYFNRELKILLNQHDKSSTSNVGFEGGVIYFNKSRNLLKYSGSQTPLYYLEEEEIKMTKYDKESIGYASSNENYKFKDYSFSTEKIRYFYISTDGYYDQVGGEKRIMFGKKRVQRLLQRIHKSSFESQKEFLYQTLIEYQGSEVRRDDITFIGFKI
jgi:serine phosphatase RsbU (regulator of sigma subunit)